jgi:hypothetical protein
LLRRRSVAAGSASTWTCSGAGGVVTCRASATRLSRSGAVVVS